MKCIILAGKMLLTTLLIFIAAPFASAVAATTYFTYEGVLTDASGTPITSTQSATLQILYNNTCVLFEESQTLNPGSSGEFSVLVGSGTRTDTTGNTDVQIFGAAQTANCNSSAATTITSTSGRTLHIRLGSTDLSPDVTIGNIPFAINAARLADKLPTDFVQTSANTTTTRVESVFSRFSTLDNLLNSASTNTLTCQSVTGTVGVANGGTGLTTVPSNGQFLTGTSSGNYQLTSFASGIGISVVNSGSVVTISSTATAGITSLTTSTPLTTSGGLTPNISLPVATTGTDGYLSKNDFINFSSKLSSTLSEGSILVGNSSNIATPVSMTGDATIDNSGSLTIGPGRITTSKLISTNPGVNRLLITDPTTGTTVSSLSCASGQTVGWNSTLGWQCSNPSTLVGATASDVVSTIVSRDSSGNFAAGDISLSSILLRNTGSQTVTLKASSTLSTSYTLTFPIFPGSAGQTLSSDGAGGLAWTNPSGSGISSLNGLTSVNQTFATSTSGTSLAFNSSGSTHTLQIPMASAAGATAGLINNTDYQIFSSKLGAVANSPLTQANIWVGNASGAATAVPVSGDIVMSTAGAMTFSGLLSVGKGGTGATTPTAAFKGLSPMTTTGDLITLNAGTPVRLPAGFDGSVLTADSTSTNGLSWLNITNVPFAGDLISMSTTGIVQRNSPSSYSAVDVLSPLIYSAGTLGLTTTGTTGAFVNSGNSFGVAASLGTVDSQPLTLITSNKPVLTIASSGNIGIGTSTPAAAGIGNFPVGQHVLEITGDGSTTSSSYGHIALSSNTSGTVGQSQYMGAISFVHHNDPGGTHAQILAVTQGSGGANGYGGALMFNTKDDNLASFSPRMYIGSSGNVGIGAFALGIQPQYKLHVLGSTPGATVAFFSDSVSTCSLTPGSGGLSCSSDERLKKNIESVQDSFSLEKILQLNTVTFQWRNSQDESSHTGYIAQQVEKVAPEIVNTTKDGWKQVNYSGVIPWITGAIKELYQRLEADHSVHQAEMASLKKEVDDLKRDNQQMKTYFCSKDASAPFCSAP